MNVPLLDLAAQYHSVESELRAAIERVLASRIYILGPEAEALERELAALCGARFGVGVSNGSDAILTSLMALGVGPGDEVIVPTFTFFATAGCVARTGARPGVRGHSARDLQHRPGCGGRRRDAAYQGDHPGSPLRPVRRHAENQGDRRPSRPGGGGGRMPGGGSDPRRAWAGPLGALCDVVLLSHQEPLGHRRGRHGADQRRAAGRAATVHPQSRPRGKQYEHHLVGGNFRIAAIQAAALRAKLPRLTEWNAARRRHAACYDRALAGSAVTPPAVDPRCVHVYHQYTIRCDRRDALRARLSEAGIGSGIYYPLPLHLQPCFAHLGGRPGMCPVAEEACRQVLSLPVCPELSAAQLDYVCRTILDFAGS